MSFLGAASSLLSGGYSSTKGKSSTSESSKLWSDKVQQAVEDKFLTGLGQIDYSQNLDLANLMADRATGFDIDVDAIMAEARRQEEMGTGQKYQSLARQAGSDANSLVAAAFNESLMDQETSLASLRAQLEAQEQESGLDALAQALDAGNATADTVLNLGNLLKGAQTTGRSITKGNKSSWEVGLSRQTQGQGQF